MEKSKSVNEIRAPATQLRVIVYGMAALFAAASSAWSSESSALRVYLFASSTCEGCKEIRTELLPKVKAHYQNAVSIAHIPVDDIEPFKLQLLYEKHYGVNDDEALKVFVGRQFLSGKKAIWERLDAVVGEELAKGSVTPTPDEIRAEAASRESNATAPAQGVGEAALQKFGTFKPTAIALAGLVDGINPCAFTTLIFFISLLAALRKGKREILIVGLCFALAVFVTYLMLGLGAMRAVKVASVNHGAARGLTWVVVAVTLGFAGYSFYDVYKYRRSGKGEDLTLKLPEKIRNRIRTMISRQMRTRNVVIAALLLGVAVSLLQAMCTAQVYLPVIMCVSRDPDMAPKAMGYLLLYNSMYVAPLMAVFALAFCGVTSERMAVFSRKNVGVTKALLGVVFLGLAILLIATSL